MNASFWQAVLTAPQEEYEEMMEMLKVYELQQQQQRDGDLLAEIRAMAASNG